MKPKTPRTAIVVAPPSTLARPTVPALDDNPLALYLSKLRSQASRRSIVSVLDRAARIFDAFDRGTMPEHSAARASSYAWGASGALTFGKVQAAVALVAEELNDDGAPKAPMARLMRTALRGVARAAFNLHLLSVEERMRIDDVDAPELSGKTRGRRLTDAEIARLFRKCAADETQLGRRDAAILAVLLGTGLRRFEVAALDVGDYKKPAKVGRDPVTLTVRAGKGKKHAEVVGSPDVAFALEDWLAVRGREPGPMFSSSPGRGRPLENGSRLSASGVYLVCWTRGDEARVSLAPHDLRRTFITTFLERTGDLALAQKAARHSSPTTTATYDKREHDALVRAFASARSGYVGQETAR